MDIFLETWYTLTLEYKSPTSLDFNYVKPCLDLIKLKGSPQKKKTRYFMTSSQIH